MVAHLQEKENENLEIEEIDEALGAANEKAKLSFATKTEGKIVMVFPDEEERGKAKKILEGRQELKDSIKALTERKPFFRL